jgi:dTMP kinase
VTTSGKLVALEGVDCAGKSTVLAALPHLLSDCKTGITTCAEFDSPIGAFVRRTLASGGSPFLKTFLFAADRALVYEATCLPSLAEGKLVIWDRYVDSAVTYRSAEEARGRLGVKVAFVREINRLFPVPDLVVLIDIEASESVRRGRVRGGIAPYDEGTLGRVRAEYLKLAARPNYVVVDGHLPGPDVAGRVAAAIRTRLKEFFE